jgi:hypothetical protein
MELGLSFNALSKSAKEPLELPFSMRIEQISSEKTILVFSFTTRYLSAV